eukprot:COSAG01_NODE_10486_length_2153_cov_104.555015_1_plen_80_part_00
MEEGEGTVDWGRTDTAAQLGEGRCHAAAALARQTVGGRRHQGVVTRPSEVGRSSQVSIASELGRCVRTDATSAVSRSAA